MPIPFTQYLRPNGQPVPMAIDRAPEIEALAERVRQQGGFFAIEVLTTGHVSMTVETHDEEGETIAIEVVENGPGVCEAVDRLVQTAAARLVPTERPS